MIKQPFFTRLQQELSQPNPNINNLLYKNIKNGQQQQFNEFVLKHLHKYIASHKYNEEIRNTLSKNINKRQLSTESQSKASQEEQSVQNNQLRVYVTNLLKNNKQLAQYKQIINLAEKNLHQLCYVKFEAGQAFNKKIYRVVQMMNTYSSFLSYFTSQGLNSKWWSKETGRKWFVHQLSNEFIQNKFMQSMSTIQLYLTDYKGGMEVLEKYLMGLSQFSIKTESGLEYNLDVLCKNTLKNAQQIKDAISIIKQMIISVKQKKYFAEEIPSKEQSSTLDQLLLQLKKQINALFTLSVFNKLVTNNQGIFQWFTAPSWVSQLDNIYYKLPYTRPNASLSDKIEAISEKINNLNNTINHLNDAINHYNHTMATIQKYSPSVNTVVHKCLFYFDIQQKEDILQPEYNFSLRDLQNIEQALNTRIKQLGIVNTQCIEDMQHQASFECLSEQVSVCVEESVDYKKEYSKNKQSLLQKVSQIIQLTQQYEQIQKDLIKVQQENQMLKTRLQQKTSQKQVKILQQQQVGERMSSSYPKQALYQFEQLTQQNHRLKEENQTYFNQKITLLNKLNLQEERSQNQLLSLRKEKESEMEQLKKKFVEDRQQMLKQIRVQHEEQKTKLKAEIEMIQQQYTNFKNKYFDQLEQSYNQSIQRYSNNRSKEQGQANLNRSMILEEQDSKDELEQIIKLQRQKQQKFNEQIEQKNKSLSLITKQLQRTKEEKESVQKLLELKLQLIQSLKQQLKKQRQERTLQQSKLKNTSEDLQKIQRTLRDLQDTILNQKKQREEIEEKKQLQQKNNQQNQLSSNLPTLVHYNRQLFNVDIFNNNQQDKKNLVDHLQWYARSRIKQTKLVYKFDSKNKINFHQYIDEIPGLTLIIKTKSAILAGFYPGVYRDKQILNKGGLIVSVTNNNSYCMQQRKKGDTKTIYRGMIYDTFFAIYGNAEIRIKTGFKTVFSNFGVSNSYFNSRGDKVDKLLNEGDKREVQFQLCEFYQVCFETQNPNFR